MGMRTTYVPNSSCCCRCESSSLFSLIVFLIRITAFASIGIVQVLHETRERKETIEYLADLKNMHKVSLYCST